MIEKRSNKYKAEKQTYNGRSYHSKKEADYAVNLDWKMKAGEIKEIIPQYKLDLRINGKHWRNYYIDFKVINTDGTVDYIEVKGFATESWKQKFDVTKIIFDDLTEGEHAFLYLNDKLVDESFE